MRIKIIWLRIIAIVTIFTVISIIIAWQAKSISESFTNPPEIIISDPAEVNETEIKKHPGAPIKNASEKVKQEFSNLTN